MTVKKVENYLGIAFLINEIIESLGEVVKSLRDEDKKRACNRLDQAASQLRDLNNRIDCDSEEEGILLREESIELISENLDSVNDIILEIKHSWLENGN